MAVDKEELRKKLTSVQYHVTQEKGTERPFSGKAHSKIVLLPILLYLLQTFILGLQGVITKYMIKVLMFAWSANNLYLAQTQNMIPVVDGLHLTMS